MNSGRVLYEESDKHYSYRKLRRFFITIPLFIIGGFFLFVEIIAFELSIWPVMMFFFISSIFLVPAYYIFIFE